ncbi:AAA family ATPase [Specibacter sp. AOP5-B1-6]|uniref:AAA family ATPase n=1 Tax=Specibacter sp. AOP5-B1-6 TaxID=3457653 RepID=UPI003FB8F71A
MTDEVGPSNRHHSLLNSPFCREDELADVLSAIRSEGSQAVFITSDNGLGASTILRELIAVVEDHVPVLAIHSSQSLAKIPYGVLAPFLSAVGTGEASIRLAVLRGVLAELKQRQEELVRCRIKGIGKSRGLPAQANDDPGRDDPPMIVIDDAHLMDAATAELIVSLVRGGTVNLVAAHSSRHALPEPLPKLWTDGMAENTVLQPLDQERTHAFCERLLGGQVLQATGWHFWTSSGGNPLFLRLLVVEALERGFLSKRRGIWVVNPNVSLHSPDLTEAVRRELRGISQQASEALNLIALSEPVEASAIETLTGILPVRELLDGNMVRFIRPNSKLLGLVNPIFGDVVREMVPISQSRLLHQRLIHELEGPPTDKEALLRRVVWSVDVGVEVPADRLLAAAVLASKLFQSQTALELASQIRGEEYRLRASMVRARAHYNLGEYQSALAQMESPEQTPGSVEELLFGSLLRASTRSALGMSVEFLAADAAALRRQGAQMAQLNPAEGETIVGLSESGAVFIELMILSRQGRYSDMTAPMSWLTAAPGISEPSARLNRAMVLTMDSERLSAQGFPVRGMARAAEAYALEHSEENDVFFLPESILLRHLAAAMCCGDWQGATKVLEEFSLETGPAFFSFGGGANVVRGMAFLRGGRASNALEVLLAGVDALQLSDPQQLLGFCTAMAAYAAARVGKMALARQLVNSHVEGRCIFLVVSHERAYLAAAIHLLKNDGGVPAELVALADAALADRSTTLELNALALIVELGDMSVVPRLARVAAEVEGHWALALCGYARALQDRDGPRLAQAGGVLSRAGLLGFAEQALELSARWMGENSPRNRMREVNASLQQVKEELGQRTHATILPATSTESLRQPSAQLTRREREVSNLAGAGLTDREIAGELVLSLRTVEGHLYRAYAKLGISGREELRELTE